MHGIFSLTIVSFHFANAILASFSSVVEKMGIRGLLKGNNASLIQPQGIFSKSYRLFISTKMAGILSLLHFLINDCVSKLSGILTLIIKSIGLLLRAFFNSFIFTSTS